MMKKKLSLGRIDDEAARGEVPGSEMSAGESIRRAGQQADDRGVMTRLPPAGRAVVAKLTEQPFVARHLGLTVAPEVVSG